jgi:hypothetical protein
VTYRGKYIQEMCTYTKKEETCKRAVRHTRFVLSFPHDLPATTAAASKSKVEEYKKLPKFYQLVRTEE